MSLKEIVICQGDKNELEEITGNKYDYLVVPVIDNVPAKKLTFFEHDFSNIPETDYVDFLMEKTVKIARTFGADAVIHYNSHVVSEGFLRRKSGYIRGTYMKKRD